MKKGKTKLIEDFSQVVVGGGPAGLRQAKLLKGESLLLIEAEDRLGGRLCESPLHLSSVSSGLAFERVFECKPALIRWEKEWTDASEFVFQEKLWHFVLPQWQLYMREQLGIITQRSFEEEAKELEHCELLLSCPVNEIEKEEGAWLLKTPEHHYRCQKVYWAAGLKAFQNAFGKNAARKFQKENSSYNPKVDETLGGLALNLDLKAEDLADDLPNEHVLFLPLRHNKLLYMAIVALLRRDDFVELKSLCYLQKELLESPKDLLSFQKSFRRSLKSLLKEGAQFKEHIFQSPSLLGQRMGMPWLLQSDDPSLIFIGDETLTPGQESLHGLEHIEGLGEGDTGDEILTGEPRQEECAPPA